MICKERESKDGIDFIQREVDTEGEKNSCVRRLSFLLGSELTFQELMTRLIFIRKLAQSKRTTNFELKLYLHIGFLVQKYEIALNFINPKSIVPFFKDKTMMTFDAETKELK